MKFIGIYVGHKIAAARAMRLVILIGLVWWTGCSTRALETPSVPPDPGRCSGSKNPVSLVPASFFAQAAPQMRKLDEFAVDGGYVYFSYHDDDAHTTNVVGGGIGRVPTNGGPIEAVLTSPTGVFFLHARNGVLTWQTENTSIQVRDLSNTPHSIHAPSGALDMLPQYIDGAGDVYFQVPGTLAADAIPKKWDHVAQQTVEIYRGSLSVVPHLNVEPVFTDEQIFFVGHISAIMSLPTAGGTFTTLVPDTAGMTTSLLGVDAERIYFYQDPAAGIMLPPRMPALIQAVPKTGGATTSLVRALPSSAFVADDKYLYWVQSADNLTAPRPVQRLAKTGDQTIQTVAADSGGAYAIAADACNLYWLTQQAVTALAKQP